MQQVSSASASAAIPPSPLVFFNDPLVGTDPALGAPSTITAAVMNIFERAYGQSDVRIAMYKMSNVDPTGLLPVDDEGHPQGPTDMRLIANAMADAAAAGAHIQLLIDGRSFTNGIVEELDSLDGIDVFRCGSGNTYGGCYQYGYRHVQHNKFVIADTLLSVPRVEGGIVNNQLAAATVSDVVLQMTSNWSNRQLNSHFFNSALEFVGDDSLYDGYEQYWTGLKNCSLQGGVDHTCGAATPTSSFSGGTGQSIVTFPRTGSADPHTNAD
jgi:hypothetical protein